MSGWCVNRSCYENHTCESWRMIYEFSVQAMVRGYHTYLSKHLGDGKLLNCKRQIGSPQDPSAVTVKKETTVVGRVLRIISMICSIFIHQGGVIVCRVNGSLEGKKLAIRHMVFVK